MGVSGSIGSPAECEAGPAFFLIFGRHRYVFVWDYLVLNRINRVFIWGQSIMGTPFLNLITLRPSRSDENIPQYP